MSVRNPNWYVLNSTRSYPVADSGNLTDASEKLLPHHIVVDLNLTFPELAGKYAFISGVTTTPRLVTVTISAAAQPAGSGAVGVPLAAVTLAQPVTLGRPYPLDALYPGVGGYIVFGPGIKEEYVGRFATIDNTMLVPEAARSYASLPLPSAGVLYDQRALTGLILLRGGSDIDVVKAVRTIEEVEREVILFRLRNKSSDDGRNVYELYSGKCNQRPETGNCGAPEPIQAVSSVTPDCCGVVTVRLKGCATPAVSEDNTAAVLDCGTGIIDICDQKSNLPDEAGNLPDMPGDDCA